MKMILRLGFCWMIVGGALLAVPTVEDFAWLTGHWRLEKGGRVIDEQWMAPAGGVMLGMARTVKDGRVVEHEFVQLRAGADDIVAYRVSASGQPEVVFRLASLKDGKAVFENLQHDFPQRISYEQRPDGSLLAAIEGPGRDGQLKRIEYPYQRITP